MDYLPESGFRLTTAPAIDRSSASPTETGPTNVDALDRLAFGLYQADGDYAVLLGSGISRAAEIPTALGNRHKPDHADCQVAWRGPAG